MKHSKWQRVIGRTFRLILIALVLSVAVQCGPPGVQTNHWEIVEVTGVVPLPKECNYVGGYGLEVLPNQPDTPPWQPGLEKTFLSENFPGDNFWYPFYKCAVAEVVVQQVPNTPATVSGDHVTLYVTHFHQVWVPVLAEKDPTQSLVYSIPITSNGQTQVVFPRVVIASTDEHTGETSGYDNLKTMGGITVNFGQWPETFLQGNPLVQAGSVQAKDCTFFASSSGVSCPP